MDILIDNLVSPVVLSFLLGMLACWLRSDLEIPDALYQGLSIYLLFAIGLKGGMALSATPVSEWLAPMLVTLALGGLTPLSAFLVLRVLGRLDRTNAAAAAAHYGSVSAVTFLASLEAAKLAAVPAEAFLPALVAVLEVPGIIVGLLLARRSDGQGMGRALQEIVTGKSIFLLLGGMLIGASCGPEKMESVAAFFVHPFKGILCVFLLELGMVTSRRLRDVRKAGARLIVAGCLLPMVHGLLGTACGVWVGMEPGGAAVLGAMVGSASYIAAPAAVRIALPEASPGIYLTMALGITFPFNLAVGIPCFLSFARFLSA